MRYFSKTQIHEELIYVVLWLVVLIAPLVDSYSKYSSGSFQVWHWNDIFNAWYGILPFFILFLVHEIWLIPHFLLCKRYLIYVLISILCLSIFSLGHEFVQSVVFKNRPERELKQHMRPFPMINEAMFNDRMYEEDMLNAPYHNDDEVADVPLMEHSMKSQSLGKSQKFGGKCPQIPGRSLPLPPFFLSTILAALMLGLNIGIKFLFKSMRDEEKMKELERQNLAQELEYLKYQINPHFFMNTLNNIHALIDIDTEKAKSTVIELSKLMRYVLYDSSHGNILLEKEIEFLKHYIALMRLRYNEKVAIEVNFPQNVGEISVPPLLFVSFIENAFKHGISYQHDSFIRISLKLESNEMFFSCVNSKHISNSDSTSGIGLDNVKKRLHLLFGSDYLLNIVNEDDVFEVLLVIPISI